MEAGAHVHEDPAHMTRQPRARAVRGADEPGSGWIAIAGTYPIWSIIALAANGLVLWAVTAHGDEFD